MGSGNAGFRIITGIERCPKEITERFSNFSPAQISDVMNRFGVMGCDMKPVSSGLKLIGPAFTVKARPGDNLMLHKAIIMAQPGDVIVVDGGGRSSQRALAGDFMCSRAKKRGIAGLVIDGLIRDIASLRNLSFPVYACGVTPLGPYKDGPGEINTTISCCGVSVEPGDLIIGDDDGVVVVPRRDAEAVARLAELKAKKEDEKRIEIEKGHVVYEWVDKVLKEKGII